MSKKIVSEGYNWHNWQRPIGYDKALENTAGICKANDNRLIITNPLRFSWDNGKTWQAPNNTAGSTPSKWETANTGHIHKTANGTLLLGANYNTSSTSNPIAIGYSTDNGESWQDSTLPSGLAEVSFCNFLDTKNGIVIANGGGNSSIGSIYSLDDGKTWLQSSLTSGYCQKPIICKNYNVVLASSINSAIYYSEDGGISWSISTATNLTSASSTCLCCANDGTAIAGLFSGSIIYSEDGGKTWQNSTLQNNLNGRPGTFYKLSNGRIIVCGYNFGIKYSDNSGKNWNDSTIVLPGGYINDIVELSPNNLLAIGSLAAGDFISIDNGVTWQVLNSPKLYNVYLTDDNTLLADVIDVNKHKYLHYLSYEYVYEITGQYLGPDAAQALVNKIKTLGRNADQTYDPTSANAQSGKAVAQAIDQAINQVLNTSY